MPALEIRSKLIRRPTAGGSSGLEHRDDLLARDSSRSSWGRREAMASRGGGGLHREGGGGALSARSWWRRSSRKVGEKFRADFSGEAESRLGNQSVPIHIRYYKERN
jgi:hypothetical protein